MSNFVAGVDEAGRGPLAGPVVAAAVVLGEQVISGLGDSKKINAENRALLSEEIKQKSIAYAFGSSSPLEIDCLNIHNATLLAMKRAIKALNTDLTTVLVDGKFTPNMPFDMRAIVKGDTFVKEISAASILAKVSRDRTMEKYDACYPSYNFKQHKGYPTKSHVSALKKFGLTPIHRISFRPVFDILNHRGSAK